MAPPDNTKRGTQVQNNLGLFLSKRATLNPHREAYVDGNGSLRINFEELNARCNRLANALLDAGVEKGERIAFLLMNSVEFMEAYFAAAKIGAIIVPLNWRLVPDELEFILKDSGAKRLIFGEEFIETATELQARGDRTDVEHWLQVTTSDAPEPFAQDYQQFEDAGSPDEPPIRAHGDDLLYIMYTSGTTGLPKGVVHSHNTTTWALITVSTTTYFHDGDRYLCALPMFHVGALLPLTLNVYRGATSVVMRSFEPKLAWELIENEKLTSGLAVPAMLNFMLQVPGFEKYDTSSLRWILSGAAPVPVALMQRYAELDIEIHQIYGLTESCGPACVIDAENALAKVGSTGKAFFHTDVRLANADGKTCAPGEPGEILVRAPHVMLEYWNRPDATAETIVDGWLRTGDIAVMDEDGFIFIQDRIKDMIISGGENVYPAEIEGVLATHPEVVDAAVIGQPSEKWGESPFAIVVRQGDSLSPEDVLAYCSKRLARYKQPTRVEFVEQIPRNPSGKILKRILREQFGL